MEVLTKDPIYDEAENFKKSMDWFKENHKPNCKSCYHDFGTGKPYPCNCGVSKAPAEEVCECVIGMFRPNKEIKGNKCLSCGKKIKEV